ncbi:integrin alpha-PS4-like isoform X2 [Zootermopsis nevadensis]|uniref:integrin alpha-PS4-like isoform X2 n=1 Tax=Zootermopsis nevadensis TaxID=136037 RepID=UPI000B8EAB80|nr:integrin alpha-PS4-like isoform X2 [Zootermopsis nevadensis]
MLVVGAPRGNSTYPEHRGVYEPGVVYQCGLDRGNNCQHIVLASKGNIEPVDYNSPVRPMRENSWLGGAIAVQDNGERFVACAPRWRNSYYRWSDYSYFMNGACYLTDSSESRKETILPLNDINKQTLRNYYLYLYGEAGFTAHFPKNSTEILLGAPGIYNWQGAVIRIRDRTFYDIRRGMQTERITDIPTPLNSLLLSTNGYFGYSVSSGRFLSARSSHLYVAGSPRNAQFRGKVCIFDFPLRSTYDLQYIRDLDGTQMGEYFGGALCVVDLNGDRLDDLVVASPQFSLQATNSAKLVGDEGRIYVFINGDKGRFKEITGDRMIMGNRRYGARFGTAVANVGDLNMDGYEGE